MKLGAAILGSVISILIPVTHPMPVVLLIQQSRTKDHRLETVARHTTAHNGILETGSTPQVLCTSPTVIKKETKVRLGMELRNGLWHLRYEATAWKKRWEKR